ncbi:MAG: hypothetical protein WCK40_00510 [Thermoleophilia bacterium]
MAKAKRARRSSFRTMDGGDDVLSRLDAIAALEAVEEQARGDASPDGADAPASAPEGTDD